MAGAMATKGRVVVIFEEDGVKANHFARRKMENAATCCKMTLVNHTPLTTRE
jgi:hypothetical protein